MADLIEGESRGLGHALLSAYRLRARTLADLQNAGAEVARGERLLRGVSARHRWTAEYQEIIRTLQELRTSRDTFKRLVEDLDRVIARCESGDLDMEATDQEIRRMLDAP